MLALLWLAGILTRSVWTPDEPREYALSVNMLSQSQWAVPQLGGQPFGEKPPLTYWAAATSMRTFGTAPTMARLPNILWGLGAVLATGALAASMAAPPLRRSAAVLASLVCGTAWLDYLHTIWLATDAPLLAGSALAMLGAWRSLSAADSGERTRAYALFHFGLAVAFLAKNLLGLIAPIGAFALFIAWERRWPELLRWQLWAGLLISGGLIGAWLLQVAHQPGGANLLRVFLWDNSVGRFLPLATTGDYRTGHLNSPGKLISEVALGLLPWLFAAVAACVRLLRLAFSAGGERAPARFLLVASLPLLLFLSFSSTVRDVYALPAMVPLTAAVALWGLATPGRATLAATRATLWIAGALLCALALLVPWIASGRVIANSRVALALVATTTLLILSSRWLAQRLPLVRGLGAYTCGLAAFLILASPGIEPGQDLRPVARAAATQAGTRTLLVTPRDETMTAALDYSTTHHARPVADFAVAVRSDDNVIALIEADTDRLTTAMRARLGRLSSRLERVSVARADGVADRLRNSGWTLELDLPNPGGRHYQLWAPPSQPRP